MKGLPLEVLEMSELEVLKLRNNPLIELPPDINKLGKLRTLVVSFCLMSSLPIRYVVPQGSVMTVILHGLFLVQI